MPDTMSIERRTLLRAFGADLVLTSGRLGMTGAARRPQPLLPAACLRCRRWLALLGVFCVDLVLTSGRLGMTGATYWCPPLASCSRACSTCTWRRRWCC